MHGHAQACVRACARTHTRTHTNTHIHAHAHTHTCTHTRTHTHINTHTRMHTQTHTCTCNLLTSPNSSSRRARIKLTLPYLKHSERIPNIWNVNKNLHTCWSLFQFQVPPFHDQAATNVAHQYQWPWSSQTTGWVPDWSESPTMSAGQDSYGRDWKWSELPCQSFLIQEAPQPATDVETIVIWYIV